MNIKIRKLSEEHLPMVDAFFAQKARVNWRDMTPKPGDESRNTPKKWRTFSKMMPWKNKEKD